jgi:hypothetical protein
MSCIYLQAVRVQTEMWVELILNWILLPQTSVTGHLSGILAGYLYYEWRTLRFDTAPRQLILALHSSLPRWMTLPATGRAQPGSSASPARWTRRGRVGAARGAVGWGASGAGYRMQRSNWPGALGWLRRRAFALYTRGRILVGIGSSRVRGHWRNSLRLTPRHNQATARRARRAAQASAARGSEATTMTTTTTTTRPPPDSTRRRILTNTEEEYLTAADSAESDATVTGGLTIEQLRQRRLQRFSNQ